jgi:hypothetical protein
MRAWEDRCSGYGNRKKESLMNVRMAMAMAMVMDARFMDTMGRTFIRPCDLCLSFAYYVEDSGQGPTTWSRPLSIRSDTLQYCSDSTA